MARPKYNLFIVQSPLQALMAQMARDQLCKSENNRLMMVTMARKSGTVGRQMNEVLDDGWTKSRLVRHSKFRGLVRSVSRLITSFWIWLAWGIPVKFFAGDHRNDWFRQLGVFSKSITYLDDGAASLKLLRDLRDKPGGAVLWPNGMPQAFSMFARPDDHQGIVLNDLSKMLLQDPARMPQGVMFVGSKHSEVGSLTMQQELQLIALTRELLDVSDVEYIAHRHETPRKLACVEAMGFEVKMLDHPLEVELVQRDRHPAIIVGGYSTVLFTARILCPQTRCIAIRFPMKIDTQARVEEIARVYEELANVGVEVMEIDLTQ